MAIVETGRAATPPFRRRARLRRWLRLACAAVSLCALASCGLRGKNGVDAPANRIFYPGGLTIDPDGRWLYVVNSNSDLRYDSGTLVAVDLDRVAAARGDQAVAAWPSCPPPGTLPDEPGTTPFCCRDPFDARIFDCDDRPFIAAGSTVRIGSFGGAIVQETYRRGGTPVVRLFVAVRADPSVTVIDKIASAGGAEVSFRCTGPRPGDLAAAPPGGGNPFCTDEWRVQQHVPAPGSDPDFILPEEPYSLAVDPDLGVLYVGHLRGGQVSLIDICAPEDAASPSLASVFQNLFRPDGNGNTGVASLAVERPGDPGAPVWATSRYSPAVGSLYVRGAESGACAVAAPVANRDIALVPGGGFVDTSVSPGTDIRGMAFSPDGQEAYLLHRSPSVLLFLDARPDATGNRTFAAIGSLELCAGPTSLVEHDAGRGSRLFVTCFDGGQIFVVDPGLAAVEAIIDAGRGPAALAFSPNDPTLAYVAGFSDQDVSVLDLRPGSATEYRVVQRIGFPSAVPR